MPYIPKPIDRYQVTMDSLDTMVTWDSMARVIDCFVEHLDLNEMGFTKFDKLLAYLTFGEQAFLLLSRHSH